MAFIDDFNNPIFREIKKDYNRAIAQKIRNRLHQLENANDKDKRRWILELLQNASDTVNVNDRNVNVEIILTEDFIEFKHNGGYFSPRNISNLVHQISSKEGEDSIGRFGTGFLTTHTLSRTVEVEGIYTENEDYYDFKVKLDRTGNTEGELVKGIEQTWDTFQTNKLEKQPENIVWSSFKYINPSKIVAKETLRDFISFVHYNLAFVPSIGNVKVIDEVNNYHYSINKKKDIEKINDYLSILTFEGSEDNNSFEKTLLLADNGQIQAVIEIDNSNNSIIPIAKNIPRLFCAFPLIGTENFTFPMVLNSRIFSPKTERDGLYLSKDTAQAKINQQLLLQVLELYKTTLEYFSNQNTDNLYLLAQHRNHFKDDYFDAKWYQNNIEKSIQKTLFTTSIVKNIHGNLITIQDAQFPFYIKNEELDKNVVNKIWEFQSVLSPNQTPQKSDIFEWVDIVWEGCSKINLKNIAEQLQRLASIQNLENHLNDEEINTLNWLDNLIDFYIENERLLLEEYKLIPNQKGIFCSKNNLNFDNTIPEILKDVYKLLGEDWRDRLLHLDIKSLISLLNLDKKVLYIGNIITGINSKIEQEKAPFESIKKAVFKLITVLPTTNEGNYVYQKSLYDFSKDLFKHEIEESLEISNLPISLWKAGNFWLLHHIANTIQAQSNIDELSQFLQKEDAKDGLAWLNTFFDFLITKNGDLGRNIIDKYAIIPNQKNIFRKREDIYLDILIHDELKDIYIIFEENWYDRLLSLNITAINDLFKTERKVLYVSNIIQGINSKIENKGTNKEQVKEAVFALTRLLPIEILEAEQQDYKTYRHAIYGFSKDLFKNDIPNSLELEGLPSQTWKNSDEWLFEYMVDTIEKQEKITALSGFLGFSTNDEGLNWLNVFFLFFIKNRKTNHFIGRNIYPNQLGDFTFKTSLFRDKKIADAFKDILHDLDNALSVEGKKGWRHLLLDKNITAFEEIPQKTTKDISDEINKKIPNLKIHPASALQKTLLKLVTLIQSENQHQRKLWEYLRAFYLDEVPKQLQIVENAADFDWQPSFLWSIEHLIKDMTALKYVDELEDKLHGNIKILDWLAGFIEFIHETEEYKKLLDGDEYAIIPNQNGSFQIKNRLYADIEIDEDLKKVIRLLNPIWLNDLLENAPIFVDLPKDRERTTTVAASEVDRIFRIYNEDAQKPEYVQAFRIISKWMPNQEEEFIRRNMDWIHSKKAEIALSLLGSEKEKDEVFQIIESGQSHLFSKIANQNFSNEELEMVSEKSEEIKNYLKILSNPVESNSSHILSPSIDDKIKKETGNKINSIDELITEFNKLLKEKEDKKIKEEQNQPKFGVKRETTGGTTDWDAVQRSNELARERIKTHLSQIKENDLPIYDLNGWTKTTNTIIENIKKNGIQIGLVTKGADNGIIYFNSIEREFLSDTKKFTELWVHSNDKIFQITLGEVFKMWNIERIKTNMFDL